MMGPAEATEARIRVLGKPQQSRQLETDRSN